MMDPFSLRYSYENKKNTFKNGGNNRHRTKNVKCKQTLNDSIRNTLHSILFFFENKFASILAQNKFNFMVSRIKKFERLVGPLDEIVTVSVHKYSVLMQRGNMAS